MDKTDLPGLAPKSALWMGLPLLDCPILDCRPGCFQAMRLVEHPSFPPLAVSISVTHCSRKIRASPVDNNKLQTILQYSHPDQQTHG